MATDPDSRLQNALNWTDEEGLGGVMLGLFTGTLLTIVYQFWALIESLGGTILKPFSAFGEALASLVEGSIGGPVVLLRASIQTGVNSLTEGLFSQLGIFAYPVTMIAVMLGLYIFAEGWKRIDLSPWNFLRNLRR